MRVRSRVTGAGVSSGGAGAMSMAHQWGPEFAHARSSAERKKPEPRRTRRKDSMNGALAVLNERAGYPVSRVRSDQGNVRTRAFLPPRSPCSPWFILECFIMGA